jgi:hypothetical protein
MKQQITRKLMFAKTDEFHGTYLDLWTDHA